VNLELDLGIDRLIRAPRKVVWDAWTDPDKLAQWWVPAPARCRVERLDVRGGGAFVTSMSDDGDVFVPHMDALFVQRTSEWLDRADGLLFGRRTYAAS
jgi:uncharacterized protein YndB with AHSA1/START domain